MRLFAGVQSGQHSIAERCSHNYAERLRQPGDNRVEEVNKDPADLVKKVKRRQKMQSSVEKRQQA